MSVLVCRYEFLVVSAGLELIQTAQVLSNRQSYCLGFCSVLSYKLRIFVRIIRIDLMLLLPLLV